jgi:hypothetical protein
MATNNSTNYKPTQYNVQSGDSNNLLNNIAPSATSGVPLISQGSSAQSIFGTALVAGGGTGLTSTTTYAVICGGTTTTGNLQSIASAGSSTNVLTSNGAGALPTFQALSASSGYVFNMHTQQIATPADASTYFLAHGVTIITITASGSARTRFYIPKAGTINKCYGAVSVVGTLGSSGNCTLALRKNNTTDTNITTTLPMSSANNNFNNTGLGISVSAGDYIEVKLTTPTWATNPTNVNISLTFLVE